MSDLSSVHKLKKDYTDYTKKNKQKNQLANELNFIFIVIVNITWVQDKHFDNTAM